MDARDPTRPTHEETLAPFATSNGLQQKAHRCIPGGAHTYAKGEDQFPLAAPGFIERGRGCRVWDVDGNEYIEYGMGLRAVTLGHAYPSVLKAVREQLEKGTNYTRPSTIEVACAEQFLQMIEGAEQVKFTKDGSTATTAAVKLARAATGRDLVALAADQGFLSYDDWFIGTTPMDAGIPESTKQLTATFRFNDLSSVEQLFRDHPEKIACLILEPARTEEPQDNFLAEVQRLCRQHGTILILDENITGFRWHNGGAQAYYGVTPDLSVFGKALANGFALSALAGRRELMQLGGLDHDQPRVFLLSTTHGGETHALAAAMAVMHAYQKEPVIETLRRRGSRLADGFRQAVARHDLEDHVGVAGHPANLVYYTLDRDRQPSQALRSLLIQELVRRGVLAPSFVVSYSHEDADIDQTIEAVDGALAIYLRALSDGVERYLVGRPSQVVFRKYN